MENNEIKKDFGSVLLKNKTNIYEQIKTYMEENGYNIKYCDVCQLKMNLLIIKMLFSLNLFTIQHQL